MRYQKLSKDFLKKTNGGSELSEAVFRFLGYTWQRAVDLPSSNDPGTEMWLTFI